MNDKGKKGKVGSWPLGLKPKHSAFENMLQACNIVLEIESTLQEHFTNNSMGKHSDNHLPCSVDLSLGILGDKWPE